MNQKSKLKKLNRILKKVRSFEPQMKKQSDEELSGLTLKFKERLAKGETRIRFYRKLMQQYVRRMRGF